MHFDVAFLGCGGVDAEAGVTDFNFDDADVKRRVARNSGSAYVVADSSKHGVVASFGVMPWFELRGLVSDVLPPRGLVDEVGRAGGRIIVPPEGEAMLNESSPSAGERGSPLAKPNHAVHVN